MAKRLLLILGAFVLIGAIVIGSVTNFRQGVLAVLRHESYYDGKPKNFWVGYLASDHPEERQKAAFALGQMGEDSADAAPKLAELLKDKVPIIRVNASLALSKIGPGAKTVVPALSEALADEEELVRFNAAMALSHIGPPAKPAIPALLEAAGRKENRSYLPQLSFSVRDQIVRTLGKIGPDAKEAMPAVLEIMQDATPLENCSCFRTLRDIGGADGSDQAIDVIVAAFQQGNVEKKIAALTALSELGTEAKRATPALTKGLKHPEDRVRVPVASTLWLISNESTLLIPVLCYALKGNEPLVVGRAAQVLGDIGSEARDAVGSLIPLLKHDDARVCYLSLDALGKIGPAAQAAIPAVKESLKDQRKFDRYTLSAVAQTSLTLIQAEAK